MKTLAFGVRVDPQDLELILRHYAENGHPTRTRSSVVSAALHHYADMIEANTEQVRESPEVVQRRLGAFVQVTTTPPGEPWNLTPAGARSATGQAIIDISQEELNAIVGKEFGVPVPGSDPSSELDLELNPEPRSEFWR